MNRFSCEPQTSIESTKKYLRTFLIETEKVILALDLWKNAKSHHSFIVRTYEDKKLGTEMELHAEYSTFLQSWTFILLLKTNFPLSNQHIKHTRSSSRYDLLMSRKQIFDSNFC